MNIKSILMSGLVASAMAMPAHAVTLTTLKDARANGNSFFNDLTPSLCNLSVAVTGADGSFWLVYSARNEKNSSHKRADKKPLLENNFTKIASLSSRAIAAKAPEQKCTLNLVEGALINHRVKGNEIIATFNLRDKGERSIYDVDLSVPYSGAPIVQPISDHFKKAAAVDAQRDQKGNQRFKNAALAE